LEDAQSKAVPSEFKTALDELTRAVRVLGPVRMSFNDPEFSGAEQVKEVMERLDQLDMLLIPLPVPPHQGTNRWRPWARALMDELIAKVVPDGAKKPHPAVPLLDEIFRAKQANDDDRFAKAVAAYSAHLKARPPAPAALDFQVPKDWDELGGDNRSQAVYFDDTLTEGTTASLFSAHGGTDSFRVNIYYFTEPTAPIEQVVNDWRIGCGYAPLDEAALQRTLTRSRIGADEAVSIDLPYTGKAGARRLRATFVRRHDDGFVIMTVGRNDAVKAEEARSAEFFASLKLGSPADARAWFGLGKGLPRNLSGSSVLVAVAKHGSDVRRFRVAGPGPLSEAERAQFLKFIEQFKANAMLHAGNRYGRALPSGWQALEGGEGPSEEFQFGDESKPRFVTVHPLADWDEGSELALFNHSRAQFGLPPTKAEELDKHVRTAKFADGDVRYVELIVTEKAPK
jgi:hypothetical protein